MRKMVVTDLNNSDLLKIERRTQIPDNFICYAPDGVKSAEVLDIVDDIDPETQEVRGKKAVINEAKKAAIEAARTKRVEEAETKRASRQAIINRLKSGASQDIKDLIEVLGL